MGDPVLELILMVPGWAWLPLIGIGLLTSYWLVGIVAGAPGKLMVRR